MEQIQYLHDLTYWSNAEMCQAILHKWKKIKPRNKETLAMLKALKEMHFYTARLREDCNKRDEIIRDVEDQRNRWCKKSVQLEQDLKMATIE